MEPLFGKTLDELRQIVSEEGLPTYAAGQMASWLYVRQVNHIEQMTDLSKTTRQRLQEKYTLGLSEPVKVQVSVDGTRKYLFTHGENRFIEAAYIPDDDRATLCVSSQVGCKMGCLFCMTARQGFQAQLTSHQILNQIRSLPEREQLTNVVYMGMGEPLDNLEQVLKSLEVLTSAWGYAWSPKRITVSTIGIIPAMKEFLQRSQCHLAVSLHSPFEDERRKLMPIEHVYPASEVISLLKSFDWSRQRRVSFEYIVFNDLNDSLRHVNALVRLLNGLSCRINLIRFHPIPGSPLEPTSEEKLQLFKDRLNQKGILTTVRASRGQDIYAACGLLSTRELVKRQEF